MPAHGPRRERPRHLLIDHLAADVDQPAVLHAGRAGGLAVAAGQAAVEVQLGLGGRHRAFEHLLDEVDAAAWRIELVAEHLVGWTGGETKPAMHAVAQDAFGDLALGGVAEGFSERGLHLRNPDKAGRG